MTLATEVLDALERISNGEETDAETLRTFSHFEKAVLNAMQPAGPEGVDSDESPEGESEDSGSNPDGSTNEDKENQ